MLIAAVRIALYMFAVNPDYIGLLFKTTYGIIMLIWPEPCCCGSSG